MSRELYNRFRKISNSYLELLDRIGRYKDWTVSRDGNLPPELLSQLERKRGEAESLIIAVEQGITDSTIGVEAVLNAMDEIRVRQIQEEASRRKIREIEEIL